MRRAWIERFCGLDDSEKIKVALHAESVDRKQIGRLLLLKMEVALHAESVDRKPCQLLIG